jgi:hypothetical protein
MAGREPRGLNKTESTGGNRDMRSTQGRISLPLMFALGLAGWALTFERAARAGEWILPDDRLGIRTAPLLLLSRPDVQTDLKLDRAQILGAQNMINELTRRAGALRGRTGTAVIAERRAIDEAQLDWLGKSLTGNQLQRLRQIEIQWEGPAAMLSRPSVAEHLRLTAEQRQRLARIVSDRAASRKRGPKDPTGDEAFNRQVQSILSPAQHGLWTVLLGTPVRFAATSNPSALRDSAVRQAGHAATAR